MSEIKLKSGLELEIEAINSATNQINSGYSNISGKGVSTLDTSMEYIEQHKKIKDILDLYGELLRKDVKDLKSMYKTLMETDEMIANKQRNSK